VIDQVVQAMQRFNSIEEMCARITAKLAQPERSEAPEVDAPGVAKTRFLNFRLGESAKDRRAPEETMKVDADAADSNTLAWLSVIEGAGRGHSFPLGSGSFQIGRGDGQDVQLDFGDNAISRKAHAAIAYYGSQRGFLLRDGLKPNPVLLNGRALQEETFLKNGDRIRLGETTLQFTLNDKVSPA
jgi:hypothetical protein